MVYTVQSVLLVLEMFTSCVKLYKSTKTLSPADEQEQHSDVYYSCWTVYNCGGGFVHFMPHCLSTGSSLGLKNAWDIPMA